MTNKTRNSRGLVPAVVALACCLGTSSHAQQADPVCPKRYQLYTVEMPPGVTGNQDGTAINEAGTVLISIPHGANTSTVTWTPEGGITVIRPTNAEWYGSDINDGGQVFGRFGFGRSIQLYLWEDGAHQTIATPAGQRPWAAAINNHGGLAGYVGDLFTFRAMAGDLENGMQQIHPAFLNQFPESYATDINDRGEICGHFGRQQAFVAFLWRGRESDPLVALPHLPGSTHSTAYTINQAGTIVGSSGDQPVRWIDEEVQLLTNVPGTALGANEAGEIVGFYTSAGNENHAFVWDSGEFVDLNDAAAGIPAGWTLAQAADVNEAGVIVGSASVAGQQFRRTFVLYPCDDEPPVITMNGEPVVSLFVGDEYVEQDATAFDEADGNIEVTISGLVDTSTAGVYEVRYDAVDSTGNAAEPEIRTVYVLPEFSANAVFGSRGVQLGDGSQVTGNVGSNRQVKLGWQARVEGDVGSAGRVFLSPFSCVEGNVEAARRVTLARSARVSGDTVEHADIPGIQLPQQAAEPGEAEPVIVGYGETISLEPGTYGPLHIHDGAVLELAAGTYHFDRVHAGHSTNIHCDLTAGTVSIDVAGSLHCGPRFCLGANVSEENNGAQDILLRIGGRRVHLGGHSAWLGTILAPHARIAVGPHCEIVGALYGRGVHLGRGSQIIGDPAFGLLLD